MDTNEIFEVCHDAMWVLIMTSAPILLTALVIGLIISLFQALTQIQEATLTFVPKILTVFFVISLSANFILSSLEAFVHRMDEKIVHIE